MSYALDPRNEDSALERLPDLNHFVVHHIATVIGCHDYETPFRVGCEIPAGGEWLFALKGLFVSEWGALCAAGN